MGRFESDDKPTEVVKYLLTVNGGVEHRKTISSLEKGKR